MTSYLRRFKAEHSLGSRGEPLRSQREAGGFQVGGKPGLHSEFLPLKATGLRCVAQGWSSCLACVRSRAPTPAPDTEASRAAVRCFRRGLSCREKRPCFTHCVPLQAVEAISPTPQGCSHRPTTRCPTTTAPNATGAWKPAVAALSSSNSKTSTWNTTPTVLWITWPYVGCVSMSSVCSPLRAQNKFRDYF